MEAGVFFRISACGIPHLSPSSKLKHIYIYEYMYIYIYICIDQPTEKSSRILRAQDQCD